MEETEEVSFSLSESLDVRIVPIDALQPNPFNPNVMNEKQFEYLKQSIERYDFLQLILCGEKNDAGKYPIMDGAHRLLALREKGDEKVPIIVAKNLPEDAADVGAFRFNRKHGHITDEGLARFLDWACEKHGVEKVKYWAGITQELVSSYFATLKSAGGRYAEQTRRMATDEDGIVRSSRRSLSTTPENEYKSPLLLYMQIEDYRYACGVLEKFDPRPADALIMLCRKYERLKNVTTRLSRILTGKEIEYLEKLRDRNIEARKQRLPNLDRLFHKGLTKPMLARERKKRERIRRKGVQMLHALSLIESAGVLPSGKQRKQGRETIGHMYEDVRLYKKLRMIEDRKKRGEG